MSSPQWTPPDAEAPAGEDDDGQFLTAYLPLGTFLVVIFLLNALLLIPVQQLSRHTLVHIAARRVVSNGRPVTIRTAPSILRAINVEYFVSARSFAFRLAQLFSIGLGVMLLLSAALFENSFRSAVHWDTRNVTLSNRTSLDDLLNRSTAVPTLREDEAVFVAPFPLAVLNESLAFHLGSDKGTGSVDNVLFNYGVRESYWVASQYSLRCLRVDENGRTVALVAALVKDSVSSTVVLKCLDGIQHTTYQLSARFDTALDGLTRNRVRLVTLKPLRNHQRFASDMTSSVFRARVLAKGQNDDDDGYEGFVAITLNSHRDSNVFWSMYGLVRAKNSPRVYRVDIWLRYASLQPVADKYPCFGEKPSDKYLGDWRLEEDQYECPEGLKEGIKRHDGELQQTGLTMHSVFDAQHDNQDLLTWLFETDYATLAVHNTFAEELAERVRARRLFYTTRSDQQINAVVRVGDGRPVVLVGRSQAFLFVAVIGVLVVSAIVQGVWSQFQKFALGISSEVVSVRALLRMLDDREDSPVPEANIGVVQFGEERRVALLKDAERMAHGWVEA